MKTEITNVNISILFYDELDDLGGSVTIDKTKLSAIITANTSSPIVFMNSKPSDELEDLGEVGLDTDATKLYAGKNTVANTIYIYTKGKATIYTPEDSSYLFGTKSANKIPSIDLSILNTSKTTNMNHIFSYCSTLTELDISNFDTSSVTDMSYMFYMCSKLATLKYNLNMNKVTNTHSMFSGCKVIKVLKLPNIPLTTDTVSMFENCKALTTLNTEAIDLVNVGSVGSMFLNCAALNTITLYASNSIKINNMSNMFSGCTTLTTITYKDDMNISNFSTAKVTNMSSMLQNCKALTLCPFLNNLDVASCTNISRMFLECNSLTAIVLQSSGSYARVQSMMYAFYNCSKATSIHLKFKLDGVDTSNGFKDAFTGCSAIQKIEAINEDNVTMLNNNAESAGIPDGITVYSSEL